MDTESKEAALALALGGYSHAERLLAVYTSRLISQGHERAVEAAYDAMVGAGE